MSNKMQQAKKSTYDENIEIYTNILAIGVAIFGFNFGQLACLIAGTSYLSYSTLKIVTKLFKKKKNWRRIFEKCSMEYDGQIPLLVKKGLNYVGEWYEFSMPEGTDFSLFNSNMEKLEFISRCKLKATITKDYNVRIQFIRKELGSRYRVVLKEFMSDKLMSVLLGVEMTENGIVPVYIDFNSTETNTLISGGAGSGKSVVVKLIMAQFILKGFRIYGIDLKGTELRHFSGYKRLNLATTMQGAEEVISELWKLYSERIRLLIDDDSSTFQEYNKKHKDRPLEPIVLLAEEYSLLSGNKELCNSLMLLLNVCRATNIMVIFTIQRPDKDQMPSGLKTNMHVRIGLKANNEVEATLISGDKKNTLMATIKNAGRCYIKDRNHTMKEEIQAFWIEDDELKDSIKECLQDKCRWLGPEFENIQNLSVTPSDEDMDIPENTPIPKAKSKSNKQKKTKKSKKDNNLGKCSIKFDLPPLQKDTQEVTEATEVAPYLEDIPNQDEEAKKYED